MPFVLANILQPLIDIFEPVLVFFHDNVGFGWGMSIVMLTVTIRALLLPLTLKQVKSMRGLQLIAPEMKKLQEKYKDDRERQPRHADEVDDHVADEERDGEQDDDVPGAARRQGGRHGAALERECGKRADAATAAAIIL